MPFVPIRQAQGERQEGMLMAIGWREAQGRRGGSGRTAVSCGREWPPGALSERQ